MILCGVALFLLPACLLCLFRDSWSLGSQSDAHSQLERASKDSVTHSSGVRGETEPLLGSINTPEAESTTRTDADVCTDTHTAHGIEQATATAAAKTTTLRLRMIPILSSITGVLAGLAGGMTVKFFSIFFIDEVGLRPISVSLIWTAAPLASVAFVLMAKHGARRFGRVQMYLAFKLVGIGLLVVMALFPE